MKILLTGFERFGGYTTNPSQRVIERLNGRMIGRAKIVGITLPVDFRRMRAVFRKAIEREKPDVLLTLGLAFKDVDSFSLETKAHRRISPKFPDNSGYLPRKVDIVKKGKSALTPTIPIAAIKGALERKGIPVKISTNAGGHMCEYVLFLGAHILRRVNPSGISGHIHLPHDPGSAREVKSKERMGFEKILRGVKIAVKECAKRPNQTF